MDGGSDRDLVTFWPRCINTHLSKDTGKIPYVMQRDFGYDSTLLTYRNDEYTNRAEETPGLDIEFLEEGGPVGRLLDAVFSDTSYGPLGDIDRGPSVVREALDGVREMIARRGEVDLLHIQGLRYSYMLTALAQRLFNPGSDRYLRIDMSSKAPAEYEEPDVTDLAPLKRLAFGLVDPALVSVETERVEKFLSEEHWLFRHYSDRLEHLPTSVDVASLESSLGDYGDKENRIIHVGRIGHPAKGSETVIEAFARVAIDHPDWTLVLVGTMRDDFEKKYRRVVDRHGIEDQVERTGYIRDRESLYDQYRRSKLFAFPSRWEGYGQAMVEAALFGNVVVGTDIPPIVEFTDDGERGYVSPVDDVDAYAANLSRAMDSPDEVRERSRRTVEYVRRNHDWRDFCRRIVEATGGNGNIEATGE